jgi:hypothetical protein
MKVRLNTGQPKLKKDGTPYKNGACVHETCDVADKDCTNKKCFRLLRDYGSYVPGRGYTSQHTQPGWVCGTRHLYGCPDSGCESEEPNEII